MSSHGGGQPQGERLPGWGVLVCTALAAFTTAVFCIASTRATAGLASIWLPNGVVLGVLVARPAAQWPVLLLCGSAAVGAANALAGFPPALNGALLLFNAAGVGLEAWVLRRLQGERELDLTRARDLASFLLPCSLLTPAVIGGLAAPVLSAFTSVSLVANFRTWYLGDTVGLLITVPLVATRWTHYRDVFRVRGREVVACVVLACAITAGTHGLDLGAWTFLAIPVLVLGTYRLGFPLAVVGTFLATLAGLGGLLLVPPLPGAQTPEDILLLQSFAMTSVFTALPVGALFEALEASRLALDEQTRRYDELADRLPAGLYTVVAPLDAPRYFEYVSPQFCRMLDVDAEAIRADLFTAYGGFPPDERERFAQQVEECLRTLRPIFFEGRMIVRGEERWLRIESMPTPLPGGASRWTSIVSDITLRKQAEDELNASARTQAVLLSEVNHRVSNNLATILGILHLEENRCRAQGHADTAAVLAEIDARIQSLATVHSLLSSNSWGPLALGQLCRLVASNAMLSGDLHVVECQPRVQVSPQQAHGLALVLSELATNALKYGHAEAERPRVGIEIQREDGSVVLTWRDEGPGFSAEALTCEPEGATLGLGLVRGLMGQLKGSVALSNDGGARVVLRFPEWVEE